MDVFSRFTGGQDRSSILNSNQHNKIQLTIFPKRPFFVAGGFFQGTVKLICKSQDICFKDLRVELLGFEEIIRNGLLNRETKRHPFAKLKTKISNSSDFLSTVEEICPGGYLSAEKGEQNLPFELALPLSLPSSTDNSHAKRTVSIKYLAVGSVDVKLPTGQLITVTQSHAITIYEKFQLKPTLNIKLTETPQSAEDIHSMPGSLPSIMFRLTIPRVVWVAGNVLSAQITIRGAIRKRIQRIQLELIEDTKHFRNSDLAFDRISSGWLLNDDTEPSSAEDSVTLANIPSVSIYNSNSNISSRNETLTLRENFSCEDNANITTSSRVVAKRALTGNLTPSQIRLEGEERTWNIQLQAPSDAYTIHKTKFLTINYRLKATVHYSFSLRFSEEIPIILFHPLSLDGDPYNSLRDGVILTTPHAFEDGQKYKVYEQPLVLFKNSLNPTSKSEHLSISHSAQNISSSSSTGCPPSPSFYSSSKSPYSDTYSVETTFPDQNIVESPSNSPLFNPAMNHSTQALQFSRDRRNSAHSHRRAKSEMNKKEFFFNSKGSGELPCINNEWDWLTSDSLKKPAFVDSTSSNYNKVFRKNRGPDLVIDVPTPNSSNTCPILYPEALTTTPITERSFQNKEYGISRTSTIVSKVSVDSNYTVKFPQSPSGIPENFLSRRRRAASLGGNLFILPESGDSSTPMSGLHPISPHFRQKFHPEVIARKYSFPPKTNHVPATPATASTFPTMTLPLKSALSTHKRSNTYSGSRGVRFALEENDTETFKVPTVIKTEEAPQSSPVSLKHAFDSREDISPSHSDGIWLTHIDYPPDKLISPSHPTSSPPQWKVISLAALPPSPISRKLSSSSSSSSDSSFVFSVPANTFLSAPLPDPFESADDPENIFNENTRNVNSLDEPSGAKSTESPKVCTVDLSSDTIQDCKESISSLSSSKILKPPSRLSFSNLECPVIEPIRISPVAQPIEYDAWCDPCSDYQPELNEFSEPSRSQHSFNSKFTTNPSSLQPLNPSKNKVNINSKSDSSESRSSFSHSEIIKNNHKSVSRGRTLELGKNFKFSSPARQLSELDNSKRNSLIEDKARRRNTLSSPIFLSYHDSHIKQD